MNIPVNEAETTALIHELMEMVSKEAKQVFVNSAEYLVQQHYGSRVGKVLEIAVEDAERTDLQWLQDRLSDKASTEIDRLQGFIKSLVEERDEARAEVERLKIILDSIRSARSLLGQLQDHMSDQACKELECILSDEPLNADGELYATPSQQAYRRGAEAMREAAADLFHGNKPGLAAIPTWSTFIRSLPIPEDRQ